MGKGSWGYPTIIDTSVGKTGCISQPPRGFEQFGRNDNWGAIDRGGGQKTAKNEYRNSYGRAGAEGGNISKATGIFKQIHMSDEILASKTGRERKKGKKNLRRNNRLRLATTTT